MRNEPTPASERARKRAAGKIRREALIKGREAYFDLLVSGYSVEQIASHTKKSPAAVRRAVGQALAKRRPGHPSGADGHRAPAAAACAPAFAWRGGHGTIRRRKKLRKSAVKILKSFVRVNLC